MKCPYCGEEILQTAKKCKHCGEWLNQEEATEEVSYNVASTNPKRSVPWWTILKGVGGLLLVALLFLGKNAGQIGRLVGKSTFYANKQANVKVTDSDIVGKWKLDGLNDPFKYEDEGVKGSGYIESVDEYFADHTEVEQGVINLTFYYGDSGDEEMEMHCSISFYYKGTWNIEDSNKLILIGEEAEAKIQNVNAKFKDEELDNDYLEEFIEESHLNEICESFKQDLLEGGTQQIIKYSHDEMVVKDSDGDEMTLTRKE